MTFQWAFDRDKLRRVYILHDAKCHGSQQNARNKAYSCLKRNFFDKWKEFHPEKRKSVLLTGSIVVFTLRLS